MHFIITYWYRGTCIAIKIQTMPHTPAGIGVLIYGGN